MFSSNLSGIVSMESPKFTSIVEILAEAIAVSANLLPVLTEVSIYEHLVSGLSTPNDVFYVWN